MNTWKKKSLSALLAAVLLASLLPPGTATATAAPISAAGTEKAAETRADTGVFTVNGGALGTDYTYSDPPPYESGGAGVLTVKTSTELTISTNNATESPANGRIVIENGVTANITLAGLSIQPAEKTSNDGYSGIDLGSGATLNLTLQDDTINEIHGGTSRTGTPAPGIHVPGGSTLTIDGDGSLEVKGAPADGRAAVGIGGMGAASENGEACGNVIILGGIITVHGGTDSTSSPPVDIGGGDTDNGKGGDCNTVIILTSVNSGEGLEIGGGSSNSGSKGSDGAGIKPTGDGTYTVYGELTLPCDITIPEGATVTIPEGASLTVPEGVTLTNNGTILVQGGAFTGDVTGNPPAYPSTVTVGFSQNGQTVTSVPYGSTVTITATMAKAETAANALSASAGTVDFYLGTVENGTKLNETDVTVTQDPDGTCTAVLEVTLDGENWKPNESPYTITADFGGYASEGDASGDSLAPATGSAQLTVTKDEQTAPSGSFTIPTHSENSIMIYFIDESPSTNENGIEIAYAEGTAASEPTSDWTTAAKDGSSYSAEIENLSPGTPYIFFVRYKGDDTHEPSPAIASSSAYYTEPKITTQSLPSAYVGVEYSQKLEAEVAEGVAVNWTIERGSLPAGLTLSSDGTITGTPTTPATQVSFNVKASVGEGAGYTYTDQDFTISVIKSDTELGNLTVSGQTGFVGHFQYGDTITVTFTLERQADTGTNALAPAANTATLTYTPDEGEEVTLATATAQADGSFRLTYDTREKKLPIGENLSLTVSYGGSSALNPVEESVTLSLDEAGLRNMPTLTGSFVYGGTLTINYTPQDDEEVTYQWFRNIDDIYSERIDGVTGETYTLTEEDIGTGIYVIVSATDEWHIGSMQSDPYQISKAPGSIEIACDSVNVGETVQPAVTSTTNEGAEVTYSYAGTGGTSYGPSATAPTAAGTYTVTATVAETATHTAAESAPVTFTIRAPEEPEMPEEPSEPSTPSGPSTSDSRGWTDIVEELDKAEDGDTITIDMGEETKVPAEVFETIAAKDVDVIFAMADGVSWTVNGEAIAKDAELSDLDLGVSMDTDGIPVDVVNAITGEVDSVQITLAHDGAFGFVMTLTAPLGAENAGYWANLYHYEEDREALSFETAAPIADDGSVRLALSHASQYAIVIDDHSHAPLVLPFDDVDRDDWFYEPVCYVYARGIMTGTAETAFSPELATTRGMIVAMLHRLEGSPSVAGALSYEDVEAGDWYAEAVRWASSEGIVAGYSAAAFGPNDAITREQLAAMLMKYSAWKGEDVSARSALNVFQDADAVSDWAQEAVSWACAEGLLAGMGDGTLAPQEKATRAQVAAVFQRFLEM